MIQLNILNFFLKGFYNNVILTFRKSLVFANILILLISNMIFAENASEGKEVKNPKIIRLTMKEAVQRAMENSPTLKNNRFELVKSDSNYLKSESKYSWKLLGSIDLSKSVLPYNQTNVLSGTKVQNDRFAGGIEKLFNTGTYFKLEASTLRFDSNAFEDPLKTPAGFSALGLPPLYTGAIAATLSQDILRNSFGLQERNLEEILKKQSEITREEIAARISNLVVQTLIDYWTYSISQSSVKTYEQLYKNTQSIRDLTKQKTNLGLAENFEINQWNALLSQTESQLEKAKLDREENKRKLIRTLALDSDIEIGEITDLSDELPGDIDYEKDLQYAYGNRFDWKSMRLRREIAGLSLKNAENNALPSLKLTGSYTAKSQNIISPQENFTNGQKGIPSNRFFDATGQLKLVYPILDKGVYADTRDAKILNAQVSIMEEDLKKEIEDDIRSRIDAVIVGNKILKNAIRTRKESESYYNGLLNSFRAGRFTAVAVKNALDTFVQNQLQEVQAKINYNINILRYDLSKNSLFSKFDIDVETIAPVIK